MLCFFLILAVQNWTNWTLGFLVYSFKYYGIDSIFIIFDHVTALDLEFMLVFFYVTILLFLSLFNFCFIESLSSKILYHTYEMFCY